MIGIYAGEGASHSWTWFVTVMEGLGSRDYLFLEGEDLRRGDLSTLSAVLIGGGDVEGMARELGEEGARNLDAFVRAGGVYLGSCAGAYLVMREVDLPPYTPFALIDAGMANYLDDPPPPLQLAAQVQGGLRRGRRLPPGLRTGAGGHGGRDLPRGPGRDNRGSLRRAGHPAGGGE